MSLDVRLIFQISLRAAIRSDQRRRGKEAPLVTTSPNDVKVENEWMG